MKALMLIRAKARSALAVMIASQAMRLRRYDAIAVMSLTAFKASLWQSYHNACLQAHNARSAYNSYL